MLHNRHTNKSTFLRLSGLQKFNTNEFFQDVQRVSRILEAHNIIRRRISSGSIRSKNGIFPGPAFIPVRDLVIKQTTQLFNEVL